MKIYDKLVRDRIPEIIENSGNCNSDVILYIHCRKDSKTYLPHGAKINVRYNW